MKQVNFSKAQSIMDVFFNEIKPPVSKTLIKYGKLNLYTSNNFIEFRSIVYACNIKNFEFYTFAFDLALNDTSDL